MYLVLFHLGDLNFFLHKHDFFLAWWSVENFRDVLLGPRTDATLNFTMPNHWRHIFQAGVISTAFLNQRFGNVE